MKKNRAESKVRKVLVANGFSLSRQRDQTHEGIDIVAMKDGEVLLIEVKKAKFHNRAWQIDAVSRKQAVTSNTIAIVMPNGAVIFQPMKEHLKLCAKNGLRYITELVNMNNLW
jgi:Holliday junction resolvase-like predicted endonuclease